MSIALKHSVPVTREDLKTIPPPSKGRHLKSESYTPIPHGVLAELAESQFVSNNLVVKNQVHGLYKEGQRYFGLYELTIAELPDMALAIGLRNGYDGMIPAGVVLGTSVFVCDNLAFHGEEKIARRHTGKIMEDLPQMVKEAMTTLMAKKQGIVDRVAAYRKFEIDNAAANDLILRAAIEFDIVPVTRAPKVWKQWMAPNHPEFRERTLWSLHNAFTEVMKYANTEDVVRQSAALHNLLDNVVKGIRLPIEGSALE